VIAALTRPWQYKPVTLFTRSCLSAFFGPRINVGGVVRLLADAPFLRELRTVFGVGHVGDSWHRRVFCRALKTKLATEVLIGEIGLMRKAGEHKKRKTRLVRFRVLRGSGLAYKPSVLVRVAKQSLPALAWLTIVHHRQLETQRNLP
jgi:hypothetical protein